MSVSLDPLDQGLQHALGGPLLFVLGDSDDERRRRDVLDRRLSLGLGVCQLDGDGVGPGQLGGPAQGTGGLVELDAIS